MSGAGRGDSATRTAGARGNEVAKLPDEEYRLADGRRPVAGAVLLRSDGATLLQHRDNIATISNPGKWSLFGGGLEAGESATDGMLRELQEEIGARPQSYRPLITLEGARTLFHLYLARLERPLEALVLGEGQAMAYVDLERALAEYDLAPVARAGLEITRSLLAMRRAQGLQTPFDAWGPV